MNDRERALSYVLNDLRVELELLDEEIDREITPLVKRRMRMVKMIWRVKTQLRLPLVDETRESAVDRERGKRLEPGWRVDVLRAVRRASRPDRGADV